MGWNSTWIWLGPGMMVIFVIACVAVIGFTLRNATRTGRDSGRGSLTGSTTDRGD